VSVLNVRLPGPTAEGLDQDHEWCEVETPDGLRRIRFHDYAEIYSIPGLYERLFYDELRCNSPSVVRGLLETVLEDQGIDPGSLAVLDLGSGNGMVGEELADAGAGTIVGIDILPEAAAATERDRPGVYDEYHVVDLTESSADAAAALTAAPFNCLTSVAALGFGDIPPLAFQRAVDAIADRGLVAFTIRDRFLDDGDQSGFSALVGAMMRSGALEPLAQHSYEHRLSAAGEPLTYQAIVARKSAR
jgi:predicted TPR repeat methyltransferase